jgi:hypothetical protein
MPVVFSPGEAETRPLNPEAIVYTTAQKVADILGIGPGEAVLVSANSVSDGVYVTGSDYRSHGFAVGDSILLYSDADPLGISKSITAISSSASGVKLAFTGSFTHADYQVADNAYVQNTASFTNGKTRGVTKAIVEDYIMRIQDRIDNTTRNAWRPSIAIAEYINFDTYKPYRRRYFTDYVGTAPLMFRNIQQILKLEVWQGDDYRELAGAEARIEIVDYSALSGKAVYLCPGDKGFATLGVGANTYQWAADFDSVTAAQALADLINKEDRVNRSNVSFSTDATPEGATFTLPVVGGTQSVYLHNEFLASANADYGNTKVKITSMKQTKGGENSTIAVNDSTNLQLDQTNATSGNSASVAGPIVTVGYIYEDGVPTTTVTHTTDFTNYGLIMVGNEVMSYTSKTATTIHPDTGVVTWGTFEGCANVSGTPLVTLNVVGTSFTQHRLRSDIGAFSDAGGDQGRLKDWWLDSEMGIIYFNNSYPFFEWNAIKASYIFGERYLEKAIEEAATKLVASDLLMSDDRSVLIPEGAQNVDLGSKIQLWRKEAEAILTRYKEIVVFA